MPVASFYKPVRACLIIRELKRKNVKMVHTLRLIAGLLAENLACNQPITDISPTSNQPNPFRRFEPF